MSADSDTGLSLSWRLSDYRGELKALTEAAATENKPEGVQFASMLAAHAEMEEQVTYPTALLIGRYVKSCVTQGVR
jgi:hypothetical protein